jgi:hypothetical protein
VVVLRLLNHAEVGTCSCLSGRRRLSCMSECFVCVAILRKAPENSTRIKFFGQRLVYDSSMNMRRSDCPLHVHCLYPVQKRRRKGTRNALGLPIFIVSVDDNSLNVSVVIPLKSPDNLLSKAFGLLPALLHF